MKILKNITKAVWILSLVSLFTDISSELLYPVMPVFLKSIGFTFFMIGLLEGIAEATAGISKGYFGNLSDAKGKRLLFVQAGYGLSAFAKIILALFSTTIPVFISRLTDRTGKGIRTSARDAILSDEAPAGKKAEVFGFHRGMDTVGAAIGPLLALFYLYFHPGEYRNLFIIAVAPGLLGVLLTFIMKEKKTVQVSENKKPGFFSFLSYWNKSTLTYRQIVSLLILFTVFNSSDVFLLLMIKQKGFSDMTMIAIYIFYNLLYAMAALPAGKIADRIGIKKMLAAGILFFAITYAAIGFVSGIGGFIFVFGIYALYAACVESNAKALITNNCNKEETATALGFFNAFNSMALLLASVWTGILWTQAGPAPALIISATGAFFCAMILILTVPGDSAKT